MSDEDYGYYIDAPGEICGEDMILVLENALEACKAYYGFIGGDDAQLGRDMNRIRIAIKALREYHKIG
jgi:hypothetical protein